MCSATPGVTSTEPAQDNVPGASASENSAVSGASGPAAPYEPAPYEPQGYEPPTYNEASVEYAVADQAPGSSVEPTGESGPSPDVPSA